MENMSLVNGMVFVKNENILKIKRRHGRFYLVSIWNREHAVEVEKLISKSFVAGWKILEEKIKKVPTTKLSRREIEIINNISDGDKVSDISAKMKDLTRSQIAGHISIIERKGFIMIDKETREITLSGISAVISEMK